MAADEFGYRAVWGRGLIPCDAPGAGTVSQNIEQFPTHAPLGLTQWLLLTFGSQNRYRKLWIPMTSPVHDFNAGNPWIIIQMDRTFVQTNR